ncbi:DgyrCDS10422 [Dimorphilus gyrociliatus]|uniref:DgyrCDS10422 n=1 Tax=Dimorphilus gyrociliatus TaxID=2664684 RepID=A0A7I8W259_9ANNE|nr:DgyrCDS10422 [Dimorphilus gyrociliatus]
MTTKKRTISNTNPRRVNNVKQKKQKNARFNIKEPFGKAIIGYFYDHATTAGHVLLSVAKFFSVLGVVIYIAVPTSIWLDSSLAAELVFLNHLQWPPFRDLRHPEKYGLEKTFLLQIDRDNDMQLGAWLVLSGNHSELYTEKNYTLALKSGIPTFLYLHGNAGTRAAWHRTRLYNVIAKTAGYNVLAIDYSGFGDSKGRPSEEQVIGDALAAYKWLLKHESKVFIWGHSLGTAISLGLAERLSLLKESYEGIILEAPFNRLEDAAKHFPLAQPFMRIPPIADIFFQAFAKQNLRFISEERITKVNSPILILHAYDDGIVPFELGEKLLSAARASNRKVSFKAFNADLGYGHKHIHKYPNLARLVKKFVSNCSNT